MPPLFLDSTARCKVTDKTIHVYQRSVLRFTSWLLEHRLCPDSASEWDDLLAEWRHAKQPSKTEFCNALAGLEFFFPQYKSQLPWAHMIKAGWETSHLVKHTVPMMGNVVRLFACHCSSVGHPALGVGMILQQKKGLRPSEMLGLVSEDVSLPEASSALGARVCIIGLGVRTGTKAKRAQSVILPESDNVDLISALRVLKAIAGPSGLLFPYSLEQYNRMLKRISKELHLDIGFTPHSLRAGFASEGRVLGKSFVELREEGRWVSDASLRIYIDVVSASSIACDLDLVGLRPALDFACHHWPRYFTVAWLHHCHAPGSASQAAGGSCHHGGSGAGGKGAAGRGLARRGGSSGEVGSGRPSAASGRTGCPDSTRGSSARGSSSRAPASTAAGGRSSSS